MSNVLEVNQQEAIINLARQGWSARRISRELGIDRRTVSRYAPAVPKCATISTAGSVEAEADVAAKCTGVSTAGNRPGRRSRCEAYAERIADAVEAGLSAQRIHQDLRMECGFEGSYESVKRRVKALKVTQPARVWRMESPPGEEMQVDFGMGPWLEAADGRRKRTWIFRAVLSHSRKAYSEAVARQDSESFLRALENAVRHFGGAPKLLNLDNLKAGVVKADWYDPQIHPKLAAFCRHYGMHAIPCRARTPEHKGKVERAVAYVNQNALKGRRFDSLAGINRLLEDWEANVADLRIHGTTRKQVRELFERERPALQALPTMVFPSYREARRTVHRDSYVEVEGSYYEVPPEYIARQVWAEWDGRVVRVYNDRREQVAMHARLERGHFSRSLGTGGHPGTVSSACRHWANRALAIGTSCGQWAQLAFERRGPEALRSVMGLCGLTKTHGSGALEWACGQALQSGASSLREVRTLLDGAPEQSAFAFAQSGPLIRDLGTYADFLENLYDQQ